MLPARPAGRAGSVLERIDLIFLRRIGPERCLVPAARLDELIGRAAPVRVRVGHGAAQFPDRQFPGSWCSRPAPFGPFVLSLVQGGFGCLAGGEEEPARRSRAVALAGNRDHAGRLELLAADAAGADDGLAPVPAVAAVVDQRGRLLDDRNFLDPAAAGCGRRERTGTRSSVAGPWRRPPFRPGRASRGLTRAWARAGPDGGLARGFRCSRRAGSSRSARFPGRAVPRRGAGQPARGRSSG